MAFGITNLSVYTTNDFEGLPVPGNAATGGPAGASGSEADLSVAAAGTTNSAIKDLGVACKSFRALAYLKTIAGTSTLECKLQVSSSATFASDVVTLDEKFMNAVAGNGIVWVLMGQSALAAGYQYVRLSFVAGAGTSATVDIIYFAA